MKNQIMLLTFLAFLFTTVIIACKGRVDYAYKSSIVVYNASAQPVSVSIYRGGELYLSFQLLKKGSFYHDQGTGDGPEAPFFDFSDSAVFVFADGKRKKDMDCTLSSDPNCRKDTTSLFNDVMYQRLYNSGRDITYIYNITHKDYAEAK